MDKEKNSHNNLDRKELVSFCSQGYFTANFEGFTRAIGGVLQKLPSGNRALGFLLSFVMMFSVLLVNKVTVVAAEADHIVISEAYGAGGNNGAVLSNDFVELYNPTLSDVDIAGWQLQYVSAAGAFPGTNKFIFPAGATVKAGGYYLLQCAAGTNVIAPLPTADSSCTIAMGAAAFKVRLTEADGTTVVDMVGAGSTASEYEGSGPTSAPSATLSVQRTPTDGTDTDDNSIDFTTAAPTPRNSSYGDSTGVAPVTSTPSTTTSNPAYVNIGSQVTLNCATEGATIFYTLNDGAETEYTTPITLNREDFVGTNADTAATIVATASKDGMTSSTTTLKFKKIDTVSIATARIIPAGSKVIVNGTVTRAIPSSAGNQGNSSLYIQDETSGIAVYKSFSISPTTYEAGKNVTVTGTLSSNNGVIQIQPAELTDIVVSSEPAAPLTPETITISELNSKSFEGKLVKISEVNLTNIATNSNHTISDGTASTTMRCLEGITLSSNFAVGNTIDVVGIAANNNGTPQILVMNETDLTKIVADVARVTANPASGSKVPAGGIVSISTATTGANIKILYKLNGGAEQTVDLNTATVTISATDFVGTNKTATIVAKATDGTYTTTESTFTYTQAQATAPTAAPASGVVPPGIMVILSSAQPGATIKYTITESGGTAGPETTYSGAFALPTDESKFPVTVTAKASLNNYLDSDSIEFTYRLGATGGYKNYFGQLHSHTAENSDGAGTLAEAYSWARDNAQLDFFAVTDHSNSFDKASTSDKAGTYNLYGYNANNLQWQNGKNAAAAALTDNFVSFYGYEMTWSGGPGHINTFATDGFVSRNNSELNTKTNDAGMRAYYELLKNTPESISQFNHPGTTFGTFSEFKYLDPTIDQRISLIEVGNGEGAVGSGGYFPSYGEYNKALDMGWHLSPTNNQDNHKKMWGNSNTARTVAYTNDFTVDGIYDALRNMSTYATEDNNLDIVYTLNRNKMGSILPTAPATAQFSVTVKDPDALDKIASVAIISVGGKEVHKQTFNSNDVTFNHTIDAPKEGYYYIKVVQQDGHIAVTAPIWLGQAPALGILDLTNDTLVPVTGESLKLTTSVFNNDNTPAKLSKIIYKNKATGEVLYTEDLDTTIAVRGTASHVFNYTPTTAGAMTVAVTAFITPASGIALEYSKDININVRDSSNLLYVGIDASHDNEYVSGNYKDSMSNFATLASKYNVRVVELKTSADLIAAMSNPKYKMMIFTVPSRRSGTIGRIPWKSYSNAEISAVSEFAKNGNTVIVTGWGDYYESYSNLKSDFSFTADQHMAAQQNKLLEAIGSTLRIADDEAKDNDNNPGSNAPRLYLTDHNNFVSPLLNGVLKDANGKSLQRFSQYGGTTIFALDESGAPTSTLPSSVTPIVSGYGTSNADGSGKLLDKINSYDDDGDGYGIENGASKPPKYASENGSTVLLTASEDVSHENGATSMVVVSGGAFMSNFEVQADLDNIFSVPYSNYNFCENLILTLTSNTTVAQAKRLPLGSDIIVEATATSSVYNGLDTNKGFFDSIYVEDATGGINVFPVSTGVLEGQMVRITGKVSEYQGERQIAVTSYRVIDPSINSVTPKAVTTKDSMLPANTGNLLTFVGHIKEIIKDDSGVVQQLLVDDGSGASRVYINGYITKNVSLAHLKVDDIVTVTGLGSVGENFSSETQFLPRIRVRDRAEIALAENYYDVVVSSTVAGGKLLSDKYLYMEGDVVTVRPTANSGYSYKAGSLKATAEDGSSVEITNNTFVMPAQKVTLTATFTQTSSTPKPDTGKDDTITEEPTETPAPKPTPLPVPVVTTDKNTTNSAITLPSTSEDEKATVSITEKVVNIALNAAIENAKNNGTALTVEFKLQAPESSTSVTAELPKASLTQITNNDAALGISSLLADIKFDSKAVSYIAEKSRSTVNISASLVDKKTLSKAALATVGENNVYNFSVTSQGSSINTFGGGKAVVTIPYKLSAGEKPNSIVIYYINDSGNLEVVKNCKYDEKTGTVSFSTTHFSKYFIGHNPKKFSDVASWQWYSGAIDFVSARDLFSGMGGNDFAPDGAMTRAMFASVLASLDNANLSNYKSSSFNDVDSDAWYSPAVAWASENGVVEGFGGGIFDPNKAITREEMAVMLYNYTVYKGIKLKAREAYSDAFNDNDKVSSWAAKAVNEMKNAGVISGVGGNNYAPKTTANRANVAAIFTNYIKISLQ